MYSLFSRYTDAKFPSVEWTLIKPAWLLVLSPVEWLITPVEWLGRYTDAHSPPVERPGAKCGGQVPPHPAVPRASEG